MTFSAKLLLGIVVAASLAGAYWMLHQSGALTSILDADALQARVVEMGSWGPVAIILLMMLAILISPIPSAPVALAAGAAYGHWWGTLYVLTGAEAGALVAFVVARFVGYETVHRWFGGRLSLGLIGSQNALMGIVFFSRLLPFVSFDIVSYGAGLTVLSFWRFAIATLAGIAPTSFLLAHFGKEIGIGGNNAMLLLALTLGALTLIPLLVKLVRHRRDKGRDGHVK